MKQKTLIFALVIFAAAVGISAQGSWLDRPMSRNWNAGDGNVPNAPRTFAAIDARCREQIRTPDSLADRAVTRAGWSLFGPSQTFGQVTVVAGMATTDGQCRPTQFNYFVFVNNRFAGTLSPDMMNSRTDASLVDVDLVSEAALRAEFARYRASDAMCCPSQRSFVNYRINRERNVVDARTVNTVAACPDDGGISTQDNVVSGTVALRTQRPIPTNAVLSVRLVDVSRQDAAATTIAEDRIDLAGKQAPFAFDLAYERNRIQDRNRYTIQAEIRDGDRLLYITDTSYPVITQGNPRSVEITLVSVGGGGGGGGNRQNVIRGTVTYRQRIALVGNSDVLVRLVDSADPNGKPVAETSVSTGTRQVPFTFELPFEMRDINRQRSYELQAEIRSNGQLRFRTERGVPVTIRGGATENVELVVIPASTEPEVITGQEFNLSKIGAGTMQAGNRSLIIIRAGVVVRSNGDATVSFSGTGGTVMFGGKLVGFDSSTLRILVQNSGNANATGEIEVRYSGRQINSFSVRDLTLDGQSVTVRF